MCSFTWVLYERGHLGQYFEGNDVPGYALYTATWGLIVPDLIERYPGNRKMSVRVRAFVSVLGSDRQDSLTRFLCSCIHLHRLGDRSRNGSSK